MLQKDGVIVIRKGLPTLHPLAAKAESLLPLLRQYLAEFGMSPASRSRIKVDGPPPNSDLQRFMEKHGK